MNKSRYLVFLLAIFLSPHALGQAADNSTLNDQILCGYQGWFTYPGDGASINKWKHWFAPGEPPAAEHLTVEMYPFMDEYDPADLGKSHIMMGSDSAKFYSAYKPNVVNKHFEWMRDYGISGVFHMRFMRDIEKAPNFKWKTQVLQNVRAAAQRYGRVFAVSYNIAGVTNSTLDNIKEDWVKLIDSLRITESGRYLRHKGLPVLRIYGIGFRAVDIDDTNAMADLINWLQDPEEQRYKVFLVGGVPSGWRQLEGDSRTDPAWSAIYKSLDGIHPWHVGRWKTISGFNTYFTNRIKADVQYCKKEKILYMPTMWPGFSWYNLKKKSLEDVQMNAIPRLGGKFMWKQAYEYANDPDIRTIWMAQFDEVDEATAIFKVAKNSSETPDEGSWLTLNADGYALPNDWYLRLCGLAQQMLKGDIPLSPTIPIEPDVEEVFPANDTFPSEEIIERADIVIYPNPFSSLIHIRSDREIRRVRITNFSGKNTGKIRAGGREMTHDLTDLNPGMYIISIEHIDGTTSLRRIIKF